MARFNSRRFVSSAILASTFAASAFSLAQTTAAQTPAMDAIRVPVKTQATPPVPVSDLGPVSAGLRIEAQMRLRRSARQEVQLDAYKQQALRTGESMTPKQFGEAFGPAPADIARVSAWLESHGLEVTSVSAAKLTMNFRGTAVQMEEAFQTEIHRYQSADRNFYFAPATQVSIPAALSAIVYGPSGLNNFGAQRQGNYGGPVSVSGRIALHQPAAQPAVTHMPAKGVTEYPQVGSVLDNARREARPDLLTPSLTVGLSTGTLAYAADGSTIITATLTYTGATAPTGAITYSDAAGLVNAQQNLSACTATGSPIVCTFPFAGAANEPTNPSAITATYSGDANFNSATGSANLAITLAAGTKSATINTFNISTGTQNYGTGTTQAITYVLTGTAAGGAPTGSVEIAASGGVGVAAYTASLATDTAHCALATRKYTCTYSWMPAATLAPGVYTLFGAYSGSATYGSVYMTTIFTVNNTTGTATTTTVSANPPGVSATQIGTTYTTVTKWTGVAAQPTGYLNLSATLASAAISSLGYVAFPAPGETSSSGSGTYDGGLYAYTYACTTDVSAMAVTCMVTDSDDYDPFAAGDTTVTAQYFGDSTYAGSSNTVVVDSGDNSTTTIAASSPSVVYGAATSETYTVVVKGTTGDGTPTGSISVSGTPVAGSPVTEALTSCTSNSNIKYTCSPAATVPAATAPGAYVVTGAYTGDSVYIPSNSTATVTVTQQAPALVMTNPTAASPTMQTYGALAAFTAHGAITWTGTGAMPTLANVSFTSTAGTFGAVSCAQGGVTPIAACTATFTPTATDAVGSYGINISFSGDTNYAAASSAQTANYVVSASTPTYVFSPNPAASVYGSTTGIPLSITITGATGGTAPSGTPVMSAADGTFSAVSCTSSGNAETCATTYTPSGLVLQGTQTGYITATLAANGNYVMSSGSDDFKVTRFTPTVTIMPSPATTVYGSTAGIALTVAVAGTGTSGDEAPSSTITMSAATGAFTTPSCSSSGTTQTCTTTYTPVVMNVGVNAAYITAATANSAGYANTSGTDNYTVTRQGLTFGAGSVMPNSVPFSSSTSVTLSQVINWTGTGTAPDASKFSFTLNSMNYTPTCAQSGDSDTCTFTVPAATVAALAIGSYPVTLTWSPAGNYMVASQPVGTLSITRGIASLSLSAATAGSPTAGTTSSLLTATLSPAVASVMVTFTDSTTGQVLGTGSTNAGGVTTLTMTTATTGVSAGLNSMVATSAPSTNYGAATSSAAAVYLSGILLTTDLTHDFSVDPGMYDGSPICNGSNGTNGSTCSTPYGIVVTNITSSSQVVTVALVNSASGAFSSATNCPVAGLAPGASCNIAFSYLPPYGDGCLLNVSCGTLNEGTFETGAWTLNDAGQLFGLAGNGGVAGFPTALEGKALLAAGSALSVTPGSLTFVAQAPGAVSATQNLTLTNTGPASLGLTYALNGTGASFFIEQNGCGATLAAGASCQIKFSYSDATVETDMAALVLTPSSGAAVTVDLTGTTAANTGLSLSTQNLNFGSVTDVTTATSTFHITNNSASAATLAFSPSGSAEFVFTTSGCPASLAAGASCQVQVAFNPTATGLVTNTLTITSNVPILPGGTGAGPYSDTVAVTGTGVTGGEFTATSAAHNFGTVAVGSQATAYGVELTNNTASPVTLALGGGTFGSNGGADGYAVQTNCGATLAVNANCDLQFTYTPTGAGRTQVLYPIAAVSGSNPVPLYSGGITYSGITLTGTGE